MMDDVAWKDIRSGRQRAKEAEMLRLESFVGGLVDEGDFGNIRLAVPLHVAMLHDWSVWGRSVAGGQGEEGLVFAHRTMRIGAQVESG